MQAVRRDLAADLCARLARVLRASIRYGLEHRNRSLAFALEAAKGLQPEATRRVIRGYLGPWTADTAAAGAAPLQAFLSQAEAQNLIPPGWRLEFV